MHSDEDILKRITVMYELRAKRMKERILALKREKIGAMNYIPFGEVLKIVGEGTK